LRHLEILDTLKMKQSLKNKKIDTYIVSDGGVHNYQSNFGLVIASQSQVVATNKGKIYSIEFHKSSYRSELYGVLAAAVSMPHIIDTHKITIRRQKELFFYCHSKSVVKTINSGLEIWRTVNQHRYPDVDIEQQLIYELKILEDKNCIITIQHVKGPQDNNTKRKLKTEESLNIEADKLTHEARRLPNVKAYSIFPTNNVNFKLNNKYINSHY
jgi:hypothetical protein